MVVLFISNHETVKPLVGKYYFNKRKMQIKRQEITKKAWKKKLENEQGKLIN